MMNKRRWILVSLSSFIVLTALNAGNLKVFADGESVQIEGVYPTGAIDPGTTVTFSTAESGFADPKYAVTDSFSASGATVGTIDKIGNFTWTPTVYDAGLHTITVTVTDLLNDSASTTVNILVATNAILLTNLSPGPIVSVYRPLTLSIDAPGFTSPTYTVYDSIFQSTLSSININSVGLLTWIPTLDDVGSHFLNVGATDIYGHSARAFQTIMVINPTVSIQSISPATTAGIGSTVSFLATATSLTNPTFTVSDTFSGTSTIETNSINSNGLFTWIPSIADLGRHVLTVTASDSYGNAASSTATFFITSAPASVQAPPVTPFVGTSTTTNASGATAQQYIFTKNLSIGSRGADVIELQERLTGLGFFTASATGYFGSLTFAGVKKFQSAHGLPRVGNVGPLTRYALNGD